MAGRIALEDFDRRADAPLAGVDGTNEAEPDDLAAESPDVPEIAPPPIDSAAMRAANLARIANALETIAAEQAELRVKSIGHATAALGAAASVLLPALARAGFAHLVAETAKTVAQHGRWPELVVSLAAEEAEAVTRYLAGATIGQRIRIHAVPEGPPGEAELGWDGGGAEIDAAAIAEAVVADYRQKLNSLAQTGA